MYSIFDLCEPRDEVLKGELREDIFATALLTQSTVTRLHFSKIPIPQLVLRHY
jgi:hypothetical protein